MVLAPQEVVMGLWLLFKGFYEGAVARLMGSPLATPAPAVARVAAG